MIFIDTALRVGEGMVVVEDFFVHRVAQLSGKAL